MKKWYMHNPESILEKKIYKFLWDFEIQTHNLISVRRPNQSIKKRIYWIVHFVVQADHRVKLKESQKRDKYLDLAWEQNNYGSCW